jgi:hypothetical protein
MHGLYCPANGPFPLGGAPELTAIMEEPDAVTDRSKSAPERNFSDQTIGSELTCRRPHSEDKGN